MRATALTVIHKFIRRELFDFAEQLFRAGPEDLEGLARAFDKLASLLQDHAMQEEAKLGPLLREADPAAARRLDQEHRRLDDQLEAIGAALHAIDRAAPSCPEALLRLHLDWNAYLSTYLAHLDEEERTLFASVGERIPPVAALAESARALGPQQGRDFLLRLWAVTTCRERSEIEEAQERAEPSLRAVG